MNAHPYIVFDFDGTIADSIDLGFRIFNRIAPEYNLQQVDEEIKKEIVTKHTQELLKKYGISHLKVITLLLRLRKEFTQHIDEITLIAGMEQALYDIKNAGLRIGILTSNSVVNVRKVMEKYGLSPIIDFVYSGKSLLGKDKVIRSMLKKEVISPDNVIYVGDETRDVEASKKAGIPVVAVPWGFSSRQLLEAAKPNEIADEPASLLECAWRLLNIEPKAVPQ
ncbi:MAG: HAD-IA family hydrolase [Bacteroidia bacterium]|nr:HAD-IA family hydrolase [Bacteroidia bacterium]